MAAIVIFGAGQIAQVAKAFIDAHGPDHVVGFTVDRAYRMSDAFEGLPLVAWEELESRFPPSEVKLLGPLSFRRMNELRRDRHLEGKARGYAFTSFIHPLASVYTTEIGENAFILENCMLQPFVRIGVGAMFWSRTGIGHHSQVGDYCFMGSGVTIGGDVRVGDRCYLAGSVTVEHGVTIGDGCYLGSSTLVRKPLPAESVVPPGKSRVAPYPASRMKHLV